MATKKKKGATKKTQTPKSTLGLPPDEVYLIVDGEGAMVGGAFLDLDVANVIRDKLVPKRGPLQTFCYVLDRDVSEGAEG